MISKTFHAFALVALTALSLGMVGCGQDPCECRYQDITDREDLREDDPLEWEDLLRYQEAVDDAAGVRARAARGAGRVRADSLADVVAEALEAETDDRAAIEQIFALGQIAAPSSLGLLEKQLHAPDPERRQRAAQALGKLGRIQALEPLRKALSDSELSVRGEAALALTRLVGRRATPAHELTADEKRLLLEGLVELLEGSADSPEGHWRAVYALANIDLPGREQHLVASLAAAGDRSRLFAVRGLQRVGNKPTIRESLPSLLDDENVFVAAAAAQALEGMGVEDALARAARRDDSPAAFHVRRAAVAAMAVNPETIDLALADKTLAVRAQALIKSATHRDYDAPLVAEWARSLLALERVAAAQAAARLEPVKARHLLARLSRDDQPQVVTAALTGLGQVEGLEGIAREMALERLLRDDLAIQGTALELLGKVGEADDLDPVVALFHAATGYEGAETRAAALRCAFAIDPEKAVDLLEEALEDPVLAVQQTAASLLQENSGQSHLVEPRQSHSTVEAVVGEDYFTGKPNPRVLLKTTKGDLLVELFRDEAPRHVKSFLQFARQGGYQGLPFHRVVTGFVVQGLDPRGDGWGTGGVVLRDEINMEPYLRGALGMPNSGRDTGGCQIFITHVPTPHLDGRYTVFGRVLEGMEVVDSLEVGDVCQQVIEQ